MNRRHFLTGTAGLFGSALLGGCGGGSSLLEAGRGRASVSVKWPERSRLIPQMANSIVVQVYDVLEVIDSITLSRPGGGSMTTTANFSDLPVKPLDVLLYAYPNVDGTGTAQAAALEAVTITSGGTASVTATMFSLVGSIDITSVGGATHVGIGATLQLIATPRDIDGNLVITPALEWSSLNPAKATVSSSGLVTGIASGSATILVEDLESNITNIFNVTI